MKGFSNTSATRHEAELSDDSLFFTPVKALGIVLYVQGKQYIVLPSCVLWEAETFLIPGLMVVLEKEHLLKSNTHF